MRPARWEERLAAAIEAAQKRRWAWGAHDCVSFALGCARAVLDGPTRWDAAIGVWGDAEQAAARLAAVGGIVACGDAHAPRIDPRFARRGDLAALPGADGQACLGVIEDGAVWVAATRGLDRARLDAALAVWAVD